MPETLKLHIQSLNYDDRLERDYYLKVLSQEPSGIVLTDDPESADRIIITDVFNVPQFDQIIENPFIKNYPEKTLIISESDQPIELWPGLYTSGLKDHVNRSFIHGWYYPYFRVRFPNPTLANFTEVSPPEKKYLASFIGYPSHIFRDRLAKLWDAYPDMYIKVTKKYHHFAEADESAAIQTQKAYLDTIHESKFSLCPRGRGPSSIRLFESMQLGVAPVIISDSWLPPSFIDWDSCSLTIKEKDVQHLRHILKSKEGESKQLGECARKVYEEYFHPKKLGTSLREAISHLTKSMGSDIHISKDFIRKTSRQRKSRYRIDYYKALFHNAMAKLGL